MTYYCFQSFKGKHLKYCFLSIICKMFKRACYVWDDELIKECDRLPAIINRASMIHSLITAYDLLRKMKVVNSRPANYEELKLFHSEMYLNHLKTFKHIDEDYMTHKEDEEYGIGYDCPPVSELYHLASIVAGSSITAAKCLLLGLGEVAINWCGGWHHAQRFGAEGFCYVNDIVICIETLRRKFQKILYIDLDVHHGNGVQDAYNLSNSVFTLSLHKFEAGFYPGTGGIEEVGSLSGKGYMCNVPLNEAYRDDNFEYIFQHVFEKVYKKFSPNALVVQCGADALAGDPHGGAGLTIEGYCNCIKRILNKNKPTILLGGGGYNHSNTAKLWASITANVVGVDLDPNIPEHDYWPQYGPDYMLKVQPLLAKDQNTKQYLDDCITKISEQLEKYLKQNTFQDYKSEYATETSQCQKQVQNKKSVYNQSVNDGKQQSQTDDDVYTFND